MIVNRDINISEVGLSEQYNQMTELNLKIHALKLQLKVINDQIDNIQNNCKHEYYLYSEGMYDDTYVCNKCGHLIEI